MKIFEEREYIDGGPSDRGIILGYHKANSVEELRKKYNINHGFIQFHEISKDAYFKKKAEAEAYLKKFELKD